MFFRLAVVVYAIVGHIGVGYAPVSLVYSLREEEFVVGKGIKSVFFAFSVGMATSVCGGAFRGR